MPSYIINAEYAIIPTPAFLVINAGVDGVPVDPPDPVFEADYGGFWGVVSTLPSFDSNTASASNITMAEITQCKLIAGRLATPLEQWSKRVIGEMFGVFDGNKYSLVNDSLGDVSQCYTISNETLVFDSSHSTVSNTLLQIDAKAFTVASISSQLLTSNIKTTVSTIKLIGDTVAVTVKVIAELQRNHTIRFGNPASLEICQDYPEYYQNGLYIINATMNIMGGGIINAQKTPTYQICKLVQKGDSFPIFSEVEVPDAVVTPPSVIIPPTRNTYMFNHTIQCFRNSDDTEINVISATITISKDQLHYTISLQLGSAGDRALIKDQEFRININGFEFHGIADQTGSGQSFPKGTYTAKGRSLSVKLTEPYVLPRTYTNTSTTTWRQAIDAEAALAGFTVTYEGFHSELNLDWALPVGVISYTDKTPLQAISRLCEVVGAVCNSHPTTETIIIKPRYKTPLWLLDGATEDFIIPSNLITDMNETETVHSAYDSLYLSGENQGVNRHVKITGSAGDKPKARILDPLFTDQIATIERGVSELSETGNIINANVTTHMFYNDVNDQLPPVPVGAILVANGVKYDVESMSISASRTTVNKVRQQLKLIRRE
jgi:hypothetical protein